MRRPRLAFAVVLVVGLGIATFLGAPLFLTSLSTPPRAPPPIKARSFPATRPAIQPPFRIQPASTCLDELKASNITFDEPIVRPRPLVGPQRVVIKWNTTASREVYDNFAPPLLTQHLLRYKVIKGTLYVDARQERAAPLWHHSATQPLNIPPTWVGWYRTEFEEMMVLASWIYDLPDMDFLWSWGDVLPSSWTVEFPILGLAMERGTGRGILTPHHRNWKETAFTKSQIRAMQACYDRRYPFRTKAPTVFWRGSATGGMRMGRRVGGLSRNIGKETFLERVQRNQRNLFALTARMYPNLTDVGITNLLSQEFGVQSGSSEAVAMEELIVKPGVLWDDWNHKAVLLGMSGHGFTDRLPLQLLGFNSLNILVDSNVVEWWQPAFTPDLDYETCKADASDFGTRAKALIGEFQSNPARLEAIVARGRATAAEAFNFFAVMDTLMHALLNASSWCHWKPELTPGFVPVQLPANTPWVLARNSIPDNARVAVQHARRANFAPAWYIYTVGCFDAKVVGWGSGAATLGRDWQNMTVDVCAALAWQVDCAYFGVQNGMDCYGLPRQPNVMAERANEACDAHCAGGYTPSDQGCGGRGLVTVYEGQPSIGSQVVYLGCADAKDWSATVVDVSERMTVQQCAHMAIRHGGGQYNFIGLQEGRVCIGSERAPEGVGGLVCDVACLGGRTLGDVSCGGFGSGSASVYSYNCTKSSTGPCYAP